MLIHSITLSMILVQTYGRVVQQFEQPQVMVSQGILQGKKYQTELGNVFYKFSGIPYAQPPIGALRLQDPLPAEGWEGLRDATWNPEKCPQLEKGRVVGYEDCLYLKVYTPEAEAPEGGRAVMVFIHGGDFLTGSMNDYGPIPLMDYGVILVVIQYRLGLLGFLSTEDSTLPGNFGLKDQTLALRWVKDNIRDFGGDPNKVTIFGQESGAYSAHYQILSPYAEGLFTRAILQSGTSLCPKYPLKGHASVARRVGQEVGCGGGGRFPQRNPDSEELLQCLRSKEIEQLVPVSEIFKVWNGLPFSMTPRVDGDYLPEDPTLLLADGNFSKVDVIIGMTSEDAGLMTSALYSNSHLLRELSQNFQEVGPISLAYQGEDFEEHLAAINYVFYLDNITKPISFEDADNITKMFTDRYVAVCSDFAALLHARAGVDVRLYELTHRGLASATDKFQILFDNKWVTQNDDLQYLFDRTHDFLSLRTHKDLRMRYIMSTLWTNFAKTGDPTPDGSLGFTWEHVQHTSLEYLDLSPTPSMQEDYRGLLRGFWLSLPTRQNKFMFPEGIGHFQVRAFGSEDRMDEMKMVFKPKSGDGEKGDSVGEISATKILDESVTKTLDESVTKTLDESVSKTLDESVSKTLDESVSKTLDESVTKTLDESATRTLDESVTKTLDESVTKTLDESATRTLDESATRTLDGSMTKILDDSATSVREMGAEESGSKQTLDESTANVEDLDDSVAIINEDLGTKMDELGTNFDREDSGSEVSSDESKSNVDRDDSVKEMTVDESGIKMEDPDEKAGIISETIVHEIGSEVKKSEKKEPEVEPKDSEPVQEDLGAPESVSGGTSIDSGAETLEPTSTGEYTGTGDNMGTVVEGLVPEMIEEDSDIVGDGPLEAEAIANGLDNGILNDIERDGNDLKLETGSEDLKKMQSGEEVTNNIEDALNAGIQDLSNTDDIVENVSMKEKEVDDLVSDGNRVDVESHSEHVDAVHMQTHDTETEGIGTDSLSMDDIGANAGNVEGIDTETKVENDVGTNTQAVVDMGKDTQRANDALQGDDFGTDSVSVDDFGTTHVEDFGTTQVEDLGTTRLEDFGTDSVSVDDFGTTHVEDFGSDSVAANAFGTHTQAEDNVGTENLILDDVSMNTQEADNAGTIIQEPNNIISENQAENTIASDISPATQKTNTITLDMPEPAVSGIPPKVGEGIAPQKKVKPSSEKDFLILKKMIDYGDIKKIMEENEEKSRNYKAQNMIISSMCEGEECNK